MLCVVLKVAVKFVFIFVVYTTVAFCIDALSVWYRRECRIVVGGCVGLMRRVGWCVVFYDGGARVWELPWY